ncbi:MAG: TIM barrel protein [Verrucomicrobia bacterium]|jgi:hypothetical protein|nr:TIM barrel protein [Verrucomicrobiota bacterium]
MQLLLTKSNWEMGEDPLEDFLRRARADGFDAVEINLPPRPEKPAEVAAKTTAHGLELLTQITTEGSGPAAHLASLEERFRAAAQAKPLLINGHIGHDTFTLEENLPIFRRACELARETGIPFSAETHRGRPTGTIPGTRQLLEALPELRLNADFSHWACVHESDLADQEATLELAMQRALHIHARVGFAEGPQVPDPLAPEWEDWTQLHLRWWRRILELRKAAGIKRQTITPEFGPPPYMMLHPGDGSPLADAWTVNCRFAAFLREQLAES